jgi:hypothetical protein
MDNAEQSLKKAAHLSVDTHVENCDAILIIKRNGFTQFLMGFWEKTEPGSERHLERLRECVSSLGDAYLSWMNHVDSQLKKELPEVSEKKDGAEA